MSIIGNLVATLTGGGQPQVAPAEAARLVKEGQAVLIDVRESDEWADGVAAPAILLALSDLRGERRAWKAFLEKNRAKRLLLYCQSGGRSGLAARTLASEGFQTANVGGIGDWMRAGLPVRKP